MKCPDEIKQLFKVLYGLTGSEAEVLYALCDEGGRASELADRMDRDRSTVQRYLSRLHETGLVEKEGRVEEGKKGRYYFYSIPDKKEMKEDVRERLDKWREERAEALEAL